ncbi:sodium:solute symporter family transporter [Lacicoccus qingdaonensis]|uniref:Solute:Na+ symporter, SSS family n=1 Tax=Lacicoccus qingdaonensis TaxID=576118 RepID=A0A1G9G581_9BACL|nr:sodium:solute symporter [Salinicoccus qingdaonensis]SDK95761.1 solute:Na+ symporter, SSS family [Salinicoccus qingdaonensis]
MELLDYLIFAVYFLLLISIGLLGMMRAKTSEQYMVADRNLGVWMLFGCLTAVFLGGSSTIGSSQLGYEMGLSGVWFVFSMGLGIALFGLLFLDRVMGYKLLTISELLGKLFGTNSKLIGAVVAAIYTLLISVTQIIAIGALLSGVFDWGLTSSILVGGAIVFGYTILGGMWTLSITDVFQFAIMTIGIFVIMLPQSLSDAGGFEGLRNNLPSTYFNFTEIGLREIMSYLLTYTLGMMVGQDIWQRYFTAKNRKVAKTAGVLVGVYSLLYSLAMVVIGMAALVVLPGIQNTQDVFTTMAFETISTGFLGVVFAAVAAAIMSTASGTLLASSTLISKDILKDHFFTKIDDAKFLLISRTTTFILAVLAIIISLWIEELLVAIDVAYAILAGSIFIPILFGLFSKKITSNAAFSAILLSAVTVLIGLWIEGLGSSNPIIYGIVVNIIVIVTVSYFDKGNRKKREALKPKPDEA